MHLTVCHVTGRYLGSDEVQQAPNKILMWCSHHVFNRVESVLHNWQVFKLWYGSISSRQYHYGMFTLCVWQCVMWLAGIQALTRINEQQTVSLWDVHTTLRVKICCATYINIKELGKVRDHYMFFLFVYLSHLVNAPFYLVLHCGTQATPFCIDLSFYVEHK